MASARKSCILGLFKSNAPEKAPILDSSLAFFCSRFWLKPWLSLVLFFSLTTLNLISVSVTNTEVSKFPRFAIFQRLFRTCSFLFGSVLALAQNTLPANKPAISQWNHPEAILTKETVKVIGKVLYQMQQFPPGFS